MVEDNKVKFARTSVDCPSPKLKKTHSFFESPIYDRKSPSKNIRQIDDQVDYLPKRHEIKGFKEINPREKCIIWPPRPSMMNSRGWVLWGVLLVFFWPLTFLPCILPCSYDSYQVPVYDLVDEE